MAYGFAHPDDVYDAPPGARLDFVIRTIAGEVLIPQALDDLAEIRAATGYDALTLTDVLLARLLAHAESRERERAELDGDDPADGSTDNGV